MPVLFNLKRFLLSKLPPHEVTKLLTEFMSSAHVCTICNGYYGSCYSEQMCAVCHAFLYLEQLECSERFHITKFEDNKSDSEDSGNEDLGPMGPVASGPFGSGDVQQGGSMEDCDIELFDLSRPSSPNLQHNVAMFAQGSLQELIVALSSPRHPRDLLPLGTMDKLPPEVLSKVFNNLDDLSRWCCSQVCKRWQSIIKSESTSARWEQFVKNRWPLFQPLFACLHEIHQRHDKPSFIHTPEICSKRIKSELKSLHAEKIQGIEAKPMDRSCTQFVASMLGPVGTPYEGGKYYLFIRISPTYPMRPPLVRFLTKIFHPNISKHGDIGLDVLLHNWCPSLTIGKVILSIQSILNDPDISLPMQADVAALFVNCREAYDAIARAWTWKYALTDCGLDV